MGLNRADITRSVNWASASRSAGNSAWPVWHSALGGLGASGSASTAQVPLKTWAPGGSPPAASVSNVQRSAWAAGEAAGAAAAAGLLAGLAAAAGDAAAGAGEAAIGL